MDRNESTKAHAPRWSADTIAPTPPEPCLGALVAARVPLMLDLFCGSGGASQAFRAAGWRVVGVDLAADVGADVVADLLTWTWDGERPDFVWASPPCEDFTRRFLPWLAPKHPDEPTQALALVGAARRIIRETQPRWWAVENVRGAIRWLGSPDQTAGPFMLWTNLPPLLLGRFGAVRQAKEKMSSTERRRRAAVPFVLSETMRRAIEEADAQETLF